MFLDISKTSLKPSKKKSYFSGGNSYTPTKIFLKHDLGPTILILDNIFCSSATRRIECDMPNNGKAFLKEKWKISRFCGFISLDP